MGKALSPKTDEKKDGLRGAFRIDDKLPFSYTPLKRGKGQAESAVQLKEDLSPLLKRLREGGTDENLLLLIESFDKKLNLIIDSLEKRAVTHAGRSIVETDINISSTGLKFSSNDRFEVGEVLSLHIELPPRPHTELSVLGEVVWVKEAQEQSERPYVVGTKYVRLDEEKRQDITRYLFDVERKGLKK